MKTRFNRVQLVPAFAVAAVAAVLALSGYSIQAATYTRDPDGNRTDDNGTWDTVSNQWWNSAARADQAWSNAGQNTAVFGVGAPASNSYTVNLNEGITVGGVTFQNQAYTIAGNTLALAGAAPTITVNAGNATIGSSITGTGLLTKDGPGTLDLSGIGNSFSGNTTVNAGVLQLSSAGGAGALWGAVAYRRIRRLLG